MHSGQLIEWKKRFWKFSLSTAVILGFNAEQQWFKITAAFNYAPPDTLPGKQWIWTESLWVWEIGLHASTYILLKNKGFLF